MAASTAAGETAGSVNPAPQVEGNPADLLTAALDGEITDEELEAVDHALDSMMLNEDGPTGLGNGKPLLTVEAAQAKLSPEILKVLAEKFKGSLTQVRYKDAQDQIF